MRHVLRLHACRAVLLALLLPQLAAAPALADTRVEAADGDPVYSTLRQAPHAGRAIALLFHQAGANRHEYDRIAPRLNRLGFDTLALDQRSGGAKFGGDNRTVQARGGSASYLPAYADLEGALGWAREHGYPTVVAVGSSYSASLTLQLAARHGDALDAVAVFSPGEYFHDPDRVKSALARITIPIYITTDPDEEARVDEVLAIADTSKITRYRPGHGVHGASTLDPQRDPEGFEANRQSFEAFMARFAPAAR